MAVRLTMNQNWQKVVKGDFTQDGLLEMVTDIDRRAKVIAPVESGALVNSGLISKIPKGYKLSFGSSRVPYARKRHFENKKNPQSKGYLTKAADAISRGNVSKYFRNKI